MTETRSLRTDLRGLDRRRSDGIDVTLLWNSRTNRVVIAVEDEREGDSFELEVHSDHALEAFHHPYAYASQATAAAV
jgi:hypothetical protein